MFGTANSICYTEGLSETSHQSKALTNPLCGPAQSDLGTPEARCMHQLYHDNRGSRQNQLWLISKLVTHLTGGGSLLLTGMDGTAAIMAAAAGTLDKGRMRVLSVRPPLDLQGFIEQVGRPGHALGDTDIERGFNVLTALDTTCDGIVLLVEDAHLLPRTTLFYLQFILRAGPPLRLAFAGSAGIADTLALEGFAGLRAHFSLHLTMAAPSAGRPTPAVQAGRYGRITQALARSAACAVSAGAILRPSGFARPAKAVPLSDAVELGRNTKIR